MLNGSTIRLVGLCLLLATPEAARAEPAQDRIALMLSGSDCSSVLETVTVALQQHNGVLHVDPTMMPDHLLVDMARQEHAEDRLTATANAAIAGSQCRAEVMKSCITAELSPSHPNHP
ncbi:MAG: hypothetical protein IT389_09570 [Nitrospira sp.]|nr:hypothetical protein [Nitrospira sp.]